MLGPRIFARTLSVPVAVGAEGRRWQYHSRSNRHGKILSWCFALDVLLQSDALRRRAAADRLVFRVGYPAGGAEDHTTLDLALGEPAEDAEPGPRTFAELGLREGLILSPHERTQLDALPPVLEGAIGRLLLATEAKAAMTAHGRAHPRLHSEMTKGHRAIRASATDAVAVGLVVVNTADRFVSADLNKNAGGLPVESENPQPRSTELIVDKMRQVRIRDSAVGTGFDAVGVIAVHCRNDDSEISVDSAPPAPQPGDRVHYDAAVLAAVTRLDEWR